MKFKYKIISVLAIITINIVIISNNIDVDGSFLEQQENSLRDKIVLQEECKKKEKTVFITQSLAYQQICTNVSTLSMYQNETRDISLMVKDINEILVNDTNIWIYSNISKESYLQTEGLTGSNGNYTLHLTSSYLSGIVSGVYNITFLCYTYGYANATKTIFLHLKSYDVTAPIVTILQPKQNQAIGSRDLTVEYKVTDDFQLREISVYIDDIIVEVLGTGVITNPENQWGNATYILRTTEVSIPKEIEGTVELKVIAIDFDFHSSEKSANIIVDTKAPTIEILKPTDEATVKSKSFTLSWFAEDNYGIDIFNIFVEEKLVLTVKTYSAQITLDYNESIYYYDIEVYAYDNVGNFDLDHIRVHVELENNFTPSTSSGRINSWQIVLLGSFTVVAGYKLVTFIKKEDQKNSTKKKRKTSRRKGNSSKINKKAKQIVKTKINRLK